MLQATSDEFAHPLDVLLKSQTVRPGDRRRLGSCVAKVLAHRPRLVVEPLAATLIVIAVDLLVEAVQVTLVRTPEVGNRDIALIADQVSPILQLAAERSCQGGHTIGVTEDHDDVVFDPVGSMARDHLDVVRINQANAIG